MLEYDVDNFDSKFSIKSTRKVIKRRRKVKRKAKKCTGRRTARGDSAAAAASDALEFGRSSRATRPLGNDYPPKLHLFGDKNALEYFSDDSDEDEDLNSSIANRDGLLVMSSSRAIGGGSGTRSLLRRKNMAAVTSTVTSAGVVSTEPDILSNIMDTMDRWHSMTRPAAIERIKINSDGSLSNVNVNDAPEQPSTSSSTSPATAENTDILNAPMYPRNGPKTGGGGNFNNSNGFRGNAGAGNSYGNSSNYSFNRGGGGGGGGSGDGGQTSFQRFQQYNSMSSDNFGPGNNSGNAGGNS